MKLGKQNKGAGNALKNQQNPIIIGAIIVVILIAGYMVARNFIGGDSGDYPAPGSGDHMSRPPLSDGPMPGPPGRSRPPGMEPPEGGPVRPAPTGALEPPLPPPTESAPPKPAASSDAKPVVSKDGMQTCSVFESVTVSYPKNWRIDISGSKTKAVFTDKKAFFEVHAPDPKAKSAKAVADAALKKVGKGAAIVAEAPDKVSGYDAYWYAVSVGGKTMRVVGIDGPTRVAVLAYVKQGSFSDYRETFDKMQSSITFGR